MRYIGRIKKEKGEVKITDLKVFGIKDTDISDKAMRKILIDILV